MTDASPEPIYLKDYTPPAYLVEGVTLHFDLDAEATRVTSRLELRRNPARGEAPLPLILLGRQLTLEELRLDGRLLTAAEYRIDAETLTIPGVPEAFVLETTVCIHPAGQHRPGGALHLQRQLLHPVRGGGIPQDHLLPRPPRRHGPLHHVTWPPTASATRCCSPTATRWPPAQLEGGRHFVTWEDPFPKPCYLFALVAGELACIEDRFVTALRDGRSRCASTSRSATATSAPTPWRSLKEAMAWDEETFGLEYDLDIYMIVAVDDFNMGAMENKGLNVFNSKYVLARPDTATDADYQAIEGVIGHEYFHNWTGNRVTCRDWFQLSLKEGLTVFRDQEFSADMTSRAVKRIADVRLLRSAQFPEDAGPMAHPVRPDSYMEINNFYTTTVYNKGAEVIRMQHTLLGADGFRRGLDLYFQRHDGQAVTTRRLSSRRWPRRAALDLSQFERWYAQAGTPVIRAARSYDAAKGTLYPDPAPELPRRPRGRRRRHPSTSRSPSGCSAATATTCRCNSKGRRRRRPAAPGCCSLLEEEQSFTFVGLPAEPVPSLLRGFSAPVRLEIDLGEEELAFLLAHDSDPFNRWEAGQQLATRLLLQQVAQVQAGREAQLPASFIAACRQLLCDEHADRALIALALTLPGETLLGEAMAVIDPEAVHTVRQAARRQLATALREELLAVMEACREPEAYSIDPAQVGRRSLKNLCLAYLMTLGEAQTTERCLEQFRGGASMTDVLAALNCLVNAAGPERTEALAAFYQRWQQRAAGHRQVVHPAGDQPPSRDPGGGRQAAHAPGLQRQESQPGALPARRLLPGQPGPLPPRRRRRLRACSASRCSPSTPSIPRWRRACSAR